MITLDVLFIHSLLISYPDVVTVGHNLITALDGVFQPIDGTSASAPIFAGIVSELNAARARVGKGPLGFLNPFLYQTAKGTFLLSVCFFPVVCC